MSTRTPFSPLSVNQTVATKNVSAPECTKRKRVKAERLEDMPTADLELLKAKIHEAADKAGVLVEEKTPRSGATCVLLINCPSNKYSEMKVTFGLFKNQPVRPHVLEAELDYRRQKAENPNLKRGDKAEASHRCGRTRCSARGHCCFEPGPYNRSRDSCPGDITCKCSELVFECPHNPKCIR